MKPVAVPVYKAVHHVFHAIEPIGMLSILSTSSDTSKSMMTMRTCMVPCFIAAFFCLRCWLFSCPACPQSHEPRSRCGSLHDPLCELSMISCRILLHCRHLSKRVYVDDVEGELPGPAPDSRVGDQCVLSRLVGLALIIYSSLTETLRARW